MVRTTTTQQPADRARERAKYVSGLLWHIGSFVIVNVFFWILDLAVGQSGAQWAFWITGFWGVALAFHLLAYFIDGRQIEDRMAEHYLKQDEAD